MSRAEEIAASPLRTRIYVDGYNLYYGCLKSTPYKWLDLMVLFERCILPSSAPAASELLPLSIKFFTAKILEKASRALDSVSSQARDHTALRKLYSGRIDIIEGYYSLTESKAKLIDPAAPATWPRHGQETLVWKLEEKQSDVNLALQAYHDAITGEVEQVVIVTNDTDIAPALSLIRSHTQVQIGLVVPARHQQRIPNSELAELAHWVRTHITLAELATAQLPRVIPGRKPTMKPESWYARPDLLEQVLVLAIPVTGNRGKAFKWMEEPNPHLDGKAPIELVETESGAAQVIMYIERYRQHLAEIIRPADMNPADRDLPPDRS
ncbi:antitoxin Xre/MbcA/ParS toxin-binding domain-containing protein [Massilia aurea]|uniref:antitoxin Xre/MbcA/ParS toxin-binding domain-containing protein n=1 Tax=Massilia aurea TaxID=373040 RepID=UPI0034636263